MSGRLTVEAMIPLMAEQIYKAHSAEDAGFAPCCNDAFEAAEELLHAAMHLPAEGLDGTLILLCGAKESLADLRNVLLAMPDGPDVSTARAIRSRINSAVEEALRVLVEQRTAPLAPDIATIVNVFGMPVHEARDDVPPSVPVTARKGQSPAEAVDA